MFRDETAFLEWEKERSSRTGTETSVSARQDCLVSVGQLQGTVHGESLTLLLVHGLGFC